MVDAPSVVNDGDAQEIVNRLGVKADMIVQELGWDEDADSNVSEAIEEAIGEELLDYETDELCDIVLLWWREDDGDLVDALVDATRNLADNGTIWLLTPAPGKPGAVEPGEINESSQLAGLVSTTSERIGQWQAGALVARGSSKK
ncbi:DUF3052 domain-containing protein [Corynebacterium guangdongense]|uniref:DUF3052 domain-containing protein n=1 Tax=Corynebacterium guangdongense TaxID=1783348 RepID=UPI0025B5E927|nr:DUF3052 domain-containing protein [Corynebacterium guangdongense]WJZ18390.1 hypothetical protein CGUA_09155 [Corynebacterium guangdongense]